MTNGYTESINRLAKSINRMRGGYAFEVVRAKMPYDERVIEKGALVLRQEEPPISAGDDLRPPRMMTARGSIGIELSATTEPQPRTIRHGADLAALCARLEAGAFEADAAGLEPDLGTGDVSAALP